MKKGLKRLSYSAVGIMYLVLLQGSLVTNSESADGCGSTWPLCDGKFLPVWNPAAMIEFSHRLVSGFAGILVVWMAVAVWRRYKERPEIRVLAPVAVIFLLIQAALGAMAVVWPQPDAVLALHFGISLVSFASVFLPVVLMRQLSGRGTGRETPVSARLKRWAFGVTAYVYGLVYTGAYVRHTRSSLACLDWPLCQGKLIPTLSGATAIQFGHRVAAAVAVALIAYLMILAGRERKARGDVYTGARIAFILVSVQVLFGGFVVLSRLTLSFQMLHSAAVSLLFAALTYVCMQTLPEPADLRIKTGSLSSSQITN